MTAASAQRIVRAAEKRDRVVMVGMNHRYRPDVQIVRSFVQSGELGRIESVRGSWHVFRPSRNQLGWRQRRDQAGGGAMLDLGLSMLDLGLWLGGNPDAGAGERQPRASRRERAVEQSRERVRRLRERHVALRRRDLASPRRRGAVRRGSPRQQGHRGDQPAHRVEGAARNAHGRVPHRRRAAGRTPSPPRTAPSGRTSRPPSRARPRWRRSQEHVVLHKIIDAIYKSAEDGRDVTL